MRTLFLFLMRLLPRSFRDEYGEEMKAVVDEHWAAIDEPGGHLGPLGRTGFWFRQCLAVVRAAVTLRLSRSETEAKGTDQVLSLDAGHPGGAGLLDAVRTDLWYALRSLARRPGFATVAVLTLGLGIGSATAIFSTVRGILLRDLPYDDADRIVVVFHTEEESGERTPGTSAATMRSLSELSDQLSHAAVAEPWGVDLRIDDRTVSLTTWSVSAGFFRALAADPLLGRTFSPEEYREGRNVVLLGHRAWRDRFGSDPHVVGRTLTFDAEPWTVVGVLPPSFKFPNRAELWIPRPPRERDASGRAADFMTGIARLAPGSSLPGARAEANRIAASLADTHPDTNTGVGLALVPLRDHLFGDVRTPLVVLFAAVGFVLLISCANVAGLVLARGAQLQREYALRSALGAGPGRLISHITLESVVLATVGCLLGVGLTYGGVRVIQGLAPPGMPRIDEIRVDGTVLLFAVGATVLSALLAGVAPSLKLSRPDLRGSLSEGARETTGGRDQRVRNRLVVLEVAASVVLVIGAGLLTRSFASLVDRQLGFEPTGRLAVQVFAYGYEEGERAVFVQEALERMGALPGVEAVAVASTIPGATDETISSIDVDVPVRIEGRPSPPSGQEAVAWVTQVSPAYFQLMEIPVVEGRGFTDADRDDAVRVALVNETFVRRHFPDGDPLGEGVSVPWEGWRPREVVGVVGDVRPRGYESEPRPEIYVPIAQVGTGSLTFLLETGGDPARQTEPAMNAIWEVNPAQSVSGAVPVGSLVSDLLSERRFNLYLLGAFAVIALFLALVGIYGLISFSVERRVAELGIRRALGGRAGDLLGMVLKQAAGLAAAGIVLGVVGALLLSRFLRSMLFGVEPSDPWTFVGLTLAVLAVATLAAVPPALRATRIDPMVALRSE